MIAIRRKFVVIDVNGTVPSDEPPSAIDKVHIESDHDIQSQTREDLRIWASLCTVGDVFKDGEGFVYVCATMWAEHFDLNKQKADAY